jgi:uncharacterized protein involved in outer membrane biogenesis
VQRLRILSWSLLILAAVMLITSIALNFIHFNGKKPSIVQMVDNVSGLKCDIKGNVGIGLFPPALILKDVNFYSSTKNLVVAAKEIKIGIRLFQLFTGGKDLINLSSVVLVKSGINPKALAFHIRTSSLPNNVENLKAIVLERCYLISANDNESDDAHYELIQDINAKVEYDAWGSSKDLTISSDLEINDVKYNFNGKFKDINNAGDSSEATFKLANDALSIGFTGSLTNFFHSPMLLGKLKSNIDDPKKLQQMLSQYPIMQSMLIDSNFNYTSDLMLSNTIMKIDNIELSSDSIEHLKGNIKVDFAYTTEINANISLDKINLDQMLSAQSNQNLSIVDLGQSAIVDVINYFEPDLDENVSAAVDLIVKEIDFNSDKITNLMVSLDAYNGEILVDEISMQMPGKGNFSLDGRISRNQVRPCFIGKINSQILDFVSFAKWAKMTDKRLANSKSFAAEADIELIPHHLMIDNIRAVFGELQFVGKMSAYNDMSSKISYKTSLRVNSLNLDDLGVNDDINQTLYDLYSSDYDKTGRKFSETTKDLRWLRTWEDVMSLEIDVDEIIYKGEHLDNASLSFELSKNSLLINRLSVESEDLTFHSSFNVTMPLFRPFLTGKLTIEKINTDKFTKLLPVFADYSKTYRDGLLKQYANSPAKSKAEEQQRKDALELSLYDLNFLGAINYDAEIDLKIINVVSSSILGVNNLSCHFSLTRGVLNIENLITGVFGGSLEANMNITVVTTIPYVNVAYALINTKPALVYNFLTGYHSNSDGYLSSSGQFNARGGTFNSLYAKLSGRAEFVALRMTIPSIDLGKIIETVESNATLSDKMKAIAYYTQYGQSVFDTVKGNITINDGIVGSNNINMQNDRIASVAAFNYSLAGKMCSIAAQYAFIPVGRTDQFVVKLTGQGDVNKPEINYDIPTMEKYLVMLDAANKNKIAQPLSDNNSLEAILKSRRGE